MPKDEMTREEALRVVTNGLRAGGDYADRDLDREDAALASLSAYGQPGECPDCPNYVGKCPRCHRSRPALATEMELMHETTDEDARAINALAVLSAPVPVGDTPMILEPLSPESFAAAYRLHAGVIESAEDFARRLGGPEFEWSITPAIAAIDSRDAAITAAAERALMERIYQRAKELSFDRKAECYPQAPNGLTANDLLAEATRELRSKLTEIANG